MANQIVELTKSWKKGRLKKGTLIEVTEEKAKALIEAKVAKLAKPKASKEFKEETILTDTQK